MTDASKFSTGDVFGWYRTSSASAMSFDVLMSNHDDGNDGTGADGATLEILGEPAATGTTRHRIMVSNQ